MWNPTLGVECLYRYDYAFPGFFPPNISNDYFVLCWQAKRAVQRGATAVIFDVSENPDAIDQVCTHRELLRHSRSQQHWNSLICLGLSVKDSPLFISEWSLAACPALLAGSVWVCVCVFVCTNNDLSIFSSVQKHADQPRSFSHSGPFNSPNLCLEECTTLCEDWKLISRFSFH